MKPVVFAQIQKVDEERRIVYGRAAEEVADRSGEIFDYATSKPYFEQWSDSVQKDSGGKSLGNVRSMHGNVAAGKVVEMVFKDDAKAIDIAAKIVDDNEWKKVLEGVHTGFSIGGSYVNRTSEMVDGKELKRYTANPNEISLVDRPCIPTAKFFDVMKADGSVQQVAFVNTDDNPHSEESMTKAEEKPAESAEEKPEGEEGKAPPAGEEKPEGEKPEGEEEEAAEEEGAEKVAKADDAEYTVEGSAEDVEALSQLMNDERLSVANVVSMVKSILPIRLLLVEPDLTKADQAPDLTPALEALGALIKADFHATVDALVKYGARNSKMDQDRIQQIHDTCCDLMAKCKMPEKAEPAGDLAKGVLSEDALQKAVAAAVEPLQKRLEDTEKQLADTKSDLKKLADQPAPTRTRLRVVAKAQDVGGEDDKETHVAPVALQGQVNEAATLIKAAHKQGGQPLLRKD